VAAAAEAAALLTHTLPRRRRDSTSNPPLLLLLLLLMVLSQGRLRRGRRAATSEGLSHAGHARLPPELPPPRLLLLLLLLLLLMLCPLVLHLRRSGPGARRRALLGAERGEHNRGLRHPRCSGTRCKLWKTLEKQTLQPGYRFIGSRVESPGAVSRYG
jgi:hypothetical protein